LEAKRGAGDAMVAKGRVLVVDDDPGVRKALKIVLTAEGFDVQTVACGEDALLACSPLPPDVVLLDVSMPGWDGYQVCERLRDTIESPDMAIIFLTGAALAGTDSHLAEMVNKSGGDYFIAKPYDPQLLIQLLHRVVREKAALVGVPGI
jgi:CheY-like chemotaxis protein